jgi:outer membrane protein assembly factor BamB
MEHDFATRDAGEAPRRPQRLVFAFSVLSGAFLVLIPIARGALEDVDRQYANFGGIACGLLALLFAQLAVSTHRRVPWFLKVGVFILPVIVVGIFLAMYEFTGFNGEVWPMFRARGVLDRDRQAHAPTPATPATALASSYRSAQFLGTNRNGVVESPEFSMRWDIHPPQELWRRKIGEGWSSFAIANGMAITLHQRDEHEVVSAWSLTTGETRWEHEIPGRHYHPMGGLGPRSTPTLVSHHGRDLVLAQSSLGIVVCLDGSDGEKLWQVNLLARAGIDQKESETQVMWGRSGSPLVVDDIVIVPMGGSPSLPANMHSLIALELADGTERWVGGDTQISYASPALLTIDGQRQIVSVNEGSVTGHNVATGVVLWSIPWPSKSNADACASQPVQVDVSKILLGKGYAQGSKLIEVRRDSKGDGESSGWMVQDIWAKPRVLKTKFTNAVIYGGKAYALSDGVLECVDPFTGDRVWRGPRYGQGQMLVVNGTILVSAEDGRIASLDRTTGQVQRELQVLDGVTWNLPAIAGPYLLLRNGSEAVCLTSPR